MSVYGLQQLVRRGRAALVDFGLGWTVLRAAKAVVDQIASTPLENRLLRIEGEKGVLGPAHRAYRGHTPAENMNAWAAYPWREDGDDWTWSAAWKASLVDDVMHRWIEPGGVVLEIGPGAGRWSVYLVNLASQLVLVDINQQTLDLSKERLNGAENVSYQITQGNGLPGVDGDTIDSIWSFDVFVHIAPIEVASYLKEVARVLRPGGRAVIHHSGRTRPGTRSARGWRSPMTAKLFANLARERALEVEAQFGNWRGGFLDFDDVITVLRRPLSPTL